MNAKIGILFAAVGLMTSTIFAQEKLQVVEPEQILTNPDHYQGKVVALHGVIDQVSSEHRTFTIIDLKGPSSATGTNVRSLIVTNQGASQIAIPKTGQEAVVFCQIEKQNGVTNFTATQLFTSQDEVQQILAKGSIVRRHGKRPGDNLGHDAQPARDIDR